MFWIPSSIFGLFALTAVGIPMLYASLAAVSLVFVMFLVALWVPYLAFERWGYTIRDDDLLITSGVFVRRWVAIPLKRIQHVDTRQGPIEQIFSLTRLQVHTASGMGADGFIPGLEIDEAERLRNHLIAKAEGDDGV